MINYVKAIDAQPKLAAAYYNAGVVHHQRNELTEAINYYEQAIELDKSIYQAYNNLAICYKIKKFDEKANNCLELLNLLDGGNN